MSAFQANLPKQAVPDPHGPSLPPLLKDVLPQKPLGKTQVAFLLSLFKILLFFLFKKSDLLLM